MRPIFRVHLMIIDIDGSEGGAGKFWQNCVLVPPPPLFVPENWHLYPGEILDPPLIGPPQMFLKCVFE